jgi:hypothetical protein
MRMQNAARPEARVLPEGLVLWPAGDTATNRLCVLISDIHCTDCTVGNQTASETDWQVFFEQLEFTISARSCDKELQALPSRESIDELILILNGDIIDLIRTSRWAEAGVYPWHRDDPRFEQTVLAIMQRIVEIHALPCGNDSDQPYSGFFYWMRRSLDRLRAAGIEVTVVPIVGNHDKELQVVPAARKLFYEQCLGVTAEQIPARYRHWVAQQMGTPEDDPYPVLPFYVADPGLRLLATHGQWRDSDNSRATANWKIGDGWQPGAWRKEQYRAFTAPCFGDTVAAGMLSHFIWNAARHINPDLKGASRLCNLLDEMDLYRPSVGAVVRLLQESRRLAMRFPEAQGLHDTMLDCFRDSLRAWLGHEETWNAASGTTWLGLHVLDTFTRLRWYWIDMALMRLMARMQEPEQDISDRALMALPAFQRGCRLLGLRLHVEGHTHVALDADLQFPRPREGRNNYTYVNLGAWRDAIVPKRNRGFRRRGVGRALFIFDFTRLAVIRSPDAYRFHIRDVTSRGDRLDMW